MEGENLLTTDVKTTFFQYLLPSIGGMLGNSLYILGDTIMVGQALGAPGLAAVNISIPLLKAANSLGLIVGVGGATALSVSRGRGDEKRANEIFNTSMILGTILGGILTFISLFFIDDLVWMLGATKFSFDMTKTYLQLVMATTLPTVWNICLGNFIRNDGSPKLVMYSSLAASLFNLVLDYILIFPMGLGIWGGALATALSPIVSIIILSFHFIKGRNKLTFKKYKPNFNIIKRILSNGFPSAVIEFTAGMVVLLFNRVILKLEGDLGVSAYSIIANLSLVFNAIFNGMGQAIQPIVSVNYGAEKMDRVFQVSRLGIVTAFVTGIGFYALGLFFPRQLASLFTSDTGELLDITINGIKIYFSAFLLMGVNIVMTSYVQSQEKSRISTILSLLRGSVYITIVLLILPKIFQINGVWLTIIVVEILTLITSVLFFEECRELMEYLKRTIVGR